MIIVISDVHLGYAKSNRESFREFLDRRMSLEIEYFVILGDLMDFWRANNAQAIVDHQDILGQIGRLKAKNVHYVPGNHDYLIHRLAKRYPERYPFRVAKKLFLETGGRPVQLCARRRARGARELQPMTIELYEEFSDRTCFSEWAIGGFATWLWGLIDNRKEIADNAGQMRLPPHERSDSTGSARWPLRLAITLCWACSRAKGSSMAIPTNRSSMKRIPLQIRARGWTRDRRTARGTRTY